MKMTEKPGHTDRKSIQATSWVVAGLLVLMCLGMGIDKAESNVDVTFVPTTATQVTLGQRIGYTVTVTNTGSADETVQSLIDLIGPDPDTTVYNVWSTPGTQVLSAGVTRMKSGRVNTADYTPQTGTFTLRAYSQDASGALSAEQSFLVTSRCKNDLGQ